MSGPAEAMRLLFADGSIVPLGKGWRYAIGGRPMTNTPRSPWDAINGAGTLYNAMIAPLGPIGLAGVARSEEHTSELQSLMRFSYAVFCLKKTNTLHRHLLTTLFQEAITHKTT